MKAAAVVLAAGRGRRFGEATKQLATVEGRPLVAHAVQSAIDAGLDEVVVVVGHDAGSVTAVLPHDPRVRSTWNPHFDEGQSTSLRAGLDALPSEVDIAVVLLGDQPGVSPSSIRAVRDAVVQGAAVARANYEDGPSHPVAFARSVWPALRALSGDEGARQIFSDLDVAEIEVRGPRPVDIDQPSDL